MKKSMMTVMGMIAGMILAQGVQAAVAMPAVATKNGCTACHAIDRKVVGPAWKDVAAKYSGTAGAEAKLIAKVSKGGSGAWGSMQMPAQDPAGKKQDAMKEAVQFILALNGAAPAVKAEAKPVAKAEVKAEAVKAPVAKAEVKAEVVKAPVAKAEVKAEESAPVEKVGQTEAAAKDSISMDGATKACKCACKCDCAK